MRQRASGFTIIEAIITVLVFTFFMGALLMILSYGFRTYSVALARSDVTTEARRMVLFLEDELRTSGYFSVSVIERKVGAQNLSRDGVCFVSMRDWSNAGSYNGLESRPNWDQYLVYYATVEEPVGKLVRMVLDPVDDDDVGSFPYPLFSAAYMLDDPPFYSGDDLVNSRVLASKVKEFRVTPVPTSQQINIRLLLRQNGVMSGRADRTREGGTFELNYTVKPQNTK